MAETTPKASGGRAAALFFTAQFILIWATFFILSSAIGWPASLDDPASVALPRLLDQWPAVLLGYGSYLAAALLIVPASAALKARLGLTGMAGDTLMGLAALSAIAKAIGISRWLFAMPVIATAYAAPGADAPALTAIFDMLNAYAGGIGETVGVGLVSGVWTILAGSGVARTRGLAARSVGAFAVVAGLLLLVNVPAGFGVELGPMLTISNVIWQFALLAIGLWALFGRSAP